MGTPALIFTPEILLLIAVTAPLALFMLLGAGWLAGWEPSERVTVRATGAAFVLAGLAIVCLSWQMAATGWQPVSVDMGSWFAVGGYHLPLSLLADHLSLPLLALTVVLSGLIGSFSSRYLHRDRGFSRFFVLLHLFAFGAALSFTAGSFDLLIAGWEFVGLTSVLLIAFFDERSAPVLNAVRVWVIYKMTDIGLLFGVFLLHHFVGSASVNALFHGNWPSQGTVLTTGAATLIGFSFLFAASGKSAQVPFSGWLPRAMEGPTPSSAIFYGAISVHLGIYLLLRSAPILQASPVVPAAVVTVGLLTAIHATLSGRVATDAKTSLSYAALAQLGVIFMEAGLGFEQLALLHVTGHAALRTLQFLRAPSMLHDDHRVHAAAGGHRARTGLHYDAILPLVARRWLYRLALERCHLDTALDRFIGGPLVACARRLVALERGGDQGRSSDPEVPQVKTELVGSIDA
jgi:NADH-quinone oxidoreductase subunit L